MSISVAKERLNFFLKVNDMKYGICASLGFALPFDAESKTQFMKQTRYPAPPVPPTWPESWSRGRMRLGLFKRFNSLQHR